MKYTLREAIARIINDKHSPNITAQKADETAIAIVEYLDKTIGLYGNGWLDNDRYILTYLGHR